MQSEKNTEQGIEGSGAWPSSDLLDDLEGVPDICLLPFL